MAKRPDAPELDLYIVAFFAVNPHEELTTQDVNVKWGPFNEATIWAAFKKLSRYGFTTTQKRSRNLVKTNIYRAGPLLTRHH